ncbi:hypothetical protein GCM10025865_16350 [Paraoerskovia sediminicola]|uniref:Uncharacterized protein n=1 Tax=Paraoerskovia sediminicola TaxID=1138587 RepID=A0ABN6XBX4_9CELL|nr:hypothetical protein GCM10025865_16350 [Paraoerskovia sediminicola]
MRLLEELRTDLRARDVARDGEDGHAGAVRVVQAVDQVQVAGAARARAHREVPGDLGLRGGHERGGLLVAHVDPFDAGAVLVGAADRVDDRVQAVADDAEDVLDPRRDELGDEQVRDGAVLLVLGERLMPKGTRPPGLSDGLSDGSSAGCRTCGGPGCGPGRRDPCAGAASTITRSALRRDTTALPQGACVRSGSIGQASSATTSTARSRLRLRIERAETTTASAPPAMTTW